VKRLAFAIILLTVFLSSGGLHGAAGNDALTRLIDRVEARRGVARRSAVVIPFVLREGVPGGEGLPAAGPDLTFTPVKDELVKLASTAEKTGFLPAGTLLAGLGRERILSRSVFLVPGEQLIVRAAFCDSRDEDAPEGEEGDTRFGPIAPHAQRKIDFMIRDRPALSDVQRIQAILAGLPSQARTVRETMAAPKIADRIKSALAKLSSLPKAYGQAVVGHVLFIGLRPVEVILFTEPEDYVRYAPEYLAAAAVSLTLWEEYYGIDPLLVKETDDRLLIPVAEKILASLRSARVKRYRPSSREKGGGNLHRVTTASDDPVMKFVGRLLVDSEKVPFHLEAYHHGKRLILPSPLTKPGGRPTDAKPDVSHGAMTIEFMRRLAARMAARGR